MPEDVELVVDLFELLFELSDLSSFFPLQLFAFGTVLDCGLILLLFLVVFVLELGILEMELLVVVDDGGDFVFEL